MSSNNININEAAENAPEQEFILTLPEAIGYLEMDPVFWGNWVMKIVQFERLPNSILGERRKSTNGLALLYRAHMLAEEYHFAKDREAGISERGEAEKKWLIASIFSKLLEDHNVGGNNCCYADSEKDEERAKASDRIPARYLASSKHASNREIFPFMEGALLRTQRINPYAPAQSVELFPYE